MKVIKSKIFQYIAILLLFGIWILFFDDYKWSRQRELKTQLRELQQELQETDKMIAEYESKNKMIENDRELMETIGRENYKMKRDDEDVFIFVTEDENGDLVPFE